ncbi:recombinase family protein [Allorhodopirellula solitaria]|uniref:Resolvase/invertase-type recombinase catalytic domain-containing protein n=1 Tax=Allorhodopirellula solitaria TaxID=2527987 RepID=A0A5C5XXH4_9BACT|nr:recombinase family protein [Allorhodopirellula solitaria]TWT67574.1 hypothetical protein CA85_24270 [Allorhodopirellula solitaria]
MTNDDSSASANLTVVYTRQSRSSDSHFSSCDAQYAIYADTAASMRFAVHDHFRDEGESSETLQRPALEELIRTIRARNEQRQWLPRLLTRVVFNPDLGTVEIQCNEDRGENVDQ